jgi:PAS domain S-box-containing protein
MHQAYSMKNLFEEIFDSAPDAIIVVNQRGKITVVNKQATKLFGYENDSLSGIGVESLIPESLHQSHKIHRETYGMSAHVREMGKGRKLLAKRKDGSEFFAAISLSPVTIDEEPHVSATIRDVTEEIEIQHQLKLQQELLSGQNTRLINFTYIVSHNLRSHASNLGIMLDFFENATSQEDKKEIMNHLKAISNGLSETITNLNDVASMQTEINANLETTNLKSYITRTEEILRGEINAKEARIINNVSDGINLQYNPAYLESILLNFVSNAIKYSHPNRDPVVLLNAFTEDRRLVLEITDNGLGIDLKKHGKQLFGLHKTFHGNKGARGIGLFISKNQVEALGGKIEVQSEAGHGTTFKIFLT